MSPLNNKKFFLPKIVITIPKLSFKKIKLTRFLSGIFLIILCWASVIYIDTSILKKVKEKKVQPVAEKPKFLKGLEKIETIEKEIITEGMSPDVIEKMLQQESILCQQSFIKAIEYYNKKDYENAINEFKNVIEYGKKENKVVISSFIYLGNIYFNLGKYNEAIYNYINAINIETDNASYHYNLGLIYEHNNQYDKAIQEYKNAIKLDNSFIDAYTALFNLYIFLNKKNEAIDIIQFGRAKNINNSELLFNQGLYYYLNKDYVLSIKMLEEALKNCEKDELKLKILNLLSNVYELNNELDKSIEYKNQYLQIKGDDLKVLENLSYAYLAKKDYISVETTLLKLLSLQPNNYKYHLLLGNLYFENNKLDFAAYHFKKAEENAKDNYSVYYALGNIYYSNNYLNLAFNYFKKAINSTLKNKYPEFFEDINVLLYNAFIKVATILSEKGYYNAAIEAFNNALIYNKYDFIYYNIGLLYEKLNLFDKAKENYLLALEMNYNNFDYNKSMGALLFKLKKYNEAKKYLDIAYKNNQNDYETLFMLAYVFYNEGNFESAIQLFKDVLNNNPSQSVLVATYKNLGNILNLMGKTDEAINYYLKGISIKNDDGILYYNTALAYINLKDYNTAIQYLKTAQKYLPDEPKIYTALGNCYFEKGLPELAEREYKKALSIDTANLELQYNLKLVREIINKKTNR
ncbi:MAG TPA: tetratricopeptide repeat protein [bacterium]|nr:tetratricopeptide repeat protein [bacterium]HOL47350.1 tetratricopeptide repeat protein [bacterium]HPQ17983.1 tetratricopeptide repeat protein [bacterium]